MKKILLLFIAICSLFLSACGESRDPSLDENSFKVYRIIRTEFQTGSELLVPEVFEISENSDAIRGAIYAVASSPSDDQLRCALPSGVSILSSAQNGSVLRLNMNSAYGKLEGVEKTLTDYCLTLTMCSLPMIDYISIYVNDELIERKLSPMDVLLENNIKSASDFSLRLYFPRTSDLSLDAEYRNISLPADSSPERSVLEELIKGPESASLLPALPESSVLLSVYTQDGLCSVSFSNSFLSDPELSPQQAQMSIYSIVNSLCSLSEVNRVQILIEGQLTQSIGGFDISAPLQKNAAIIATA